VSVEIKIITALKFSGGKLHDLAALGFSVVTFLHGSIKMQINNMGKYIILFEVLKSHIANRRL